MRQFEFEALQQIKAGNFPRAAFSDILSDSSLEWKIKEPDEQFAIADQVFQLLHANNCTIKEIVLDPSSREISFYKDDVVDFISAKNWNHLMGRHNSFINESVLGIDIYYTQELTFSDLLELDKSTNRILLMDPLPRLRLNLGLHIKR